MLMAALLEDQRKKNSPAISANNPKHKELDFCFDCSRVLCEDWRTFELKNSNHLSHHIAPLKDVLPELRGRLGAVHKLLDDFNLKQDSSLNELLQLEEEKKAQVDDLKAIVDECADRIHREVELMRTNAKQTIERRAAEIWAADPEDSRKQEIQKELEQFQMKRKAIDRELLRCEGDELYLLEKQKDLECFANELFDFLQKEYQIPARFCYHLSELRREIRDCMGSFQREFDGTKDKFIANIREPFPFPHPEQLSLSTKAVLTVPKQSLILPSDNIKSLSIKGIIFAGDKTDEIYFVDSDNSKIKLLDLKTNLPTEVFSGRNGTKLNGLINASDDPLNPMIITTEKTFGTPKTLRALFLRRSPNGKLEVVQSALIEEKKMNDALFARWSGANIFCAINCSHSLYEFCLTPDVMQCSFEEKPRVHRMPDMVLDICGLQLNGQHRLLVSFGDSSLVVFKVCKNTLLQLQCIERSRGHRMIGRLIGLPGGSVLVESRFEDGSRNDFEFGIACYAVQPDGSLAALKRLHTEDRWFGLKILLPPSATFLINHFVADLNGNLCLFNIQSA